MRVEGGTGLGGERDVIADSGIVGSGVRMDVEAGDLKDGCSPDVHGGNQRGNNGERDGLAPMESGATPLAGDVHVDEGEEQQKLGRQPMEQQRRLGKAQEDKEDEEEDWMVEDSQYNEDARNGQTDDTVEEGEEEKEKDREEEEEEVVEEEEEEEGLPERTPGRWWDQSCEISPLSILLRIWLSRPSLDPAGLWKAGGLHGCKDRW